MSYGEFSNQVEMLLQDQSFFESQLNDELSGPKFEHLINSGSTMCKVLKSVVDRGERFGNSHNDKLPKFIDTIIDYHKFLLPPKVCGGFCPCLKPAKSGPEFDRQYTIVLVKVLTTIFISKAIIIEEKGEKLNVDSVQYQAYTNKMCEIFKTLDNIQTQKSTDAAKENARVDLLGALEKVNKFLRSFEEETEEFKNEALRRATMAHEILENPTKEITRRTLVKAQSSLQEIMNSAADVSMNKAKSALQELEHLTNVMNRARGEQQEGFQRLEGEMQENGTINFFNKLREDIDINNSDANSKLRDASKRWNNIKSQSNARPVVEFKEESASDNIFGGSGSILSSPKEGGVGKSISNVGAAGQKVLSAPGNAVLGVFDKVAEVGGKGASKLASGFDKMGNNIKSVGEKAKNVFSLGDSDSPPPRPLAGGGQRPPNPAQRSAQPQKPSTTSSTANKKSNNFFD